MIKVKKSKYRKGQLAIHFGTTKPRHLSSREAYELADDLVKEADKVAGGER